MRVHSCSLECSIKKVKEFKRIALEAEEAELAAKRAADEAADAAAPAAAAPAAGGKKGKKQGGGKNMLEESKNDDVIF